MSYEATVQVVCGQDDHHRTIGVFARYEGRWSAPAAEFATDAEISRAEGRANSEQRRGRVQSRHRGGMTRTRAGWALECPKCHRREPMSWSKLERLLNGLADNGVATIDLAHLRLVD